MLKNEFHRAIYGEGCEGNELTKRIIKNAYDIRKSGFSKREFLINEQKSNPELLGVPVREILRLF